MILGNVHDETSVPVHGTLTWTEAPAALHNAVAIYLGPYTAEEVVAAYRTFYPDRSPIEIVTAAATALRAWPGQVLEAERRAANPTSQRRTWVYQMNWHRDAPGARAMHTIDIPFMFDNLAAAPGQIGSTREEIAIAQPLADAMSGMLIHYAATGNPSHPGLPAWPPYDLQRRNTMIWDNPPASRRIRAARSAVTLPARPTANPEPTSLRIWPQIRNAGLHCSRSGVVPLCPLWQARSVSSATNFFAASIHDRYCTKGSPDRRASFDTLNSAS